GPRDAAPGDRPAAGAEGDRGPRRHDAPRRPGGGARGGHAGARGVRRGGRARAPPAPLRGQQPVPRAPHGRGPRRLRHLPGGPARRGGRAARPRLVRGKPVPPGVQVAADQARAPVRRLRGRRPRARPCPHRHPRRDGGPSRTALTDELVTRPAAWMVQALRARELGAVELLEAHLAAVEESNAAVNAIVLPRFEEARAEAAAADTARARGEPLGPLHGLPFTVKDPIPVAGMRSPNGCRLLADHVDAQDAVVVGLLRRAGAVLIGKTNVSELSSWWDSVNPLFGATANPHDPTRTAGGSSGGEAAALATGMSPLGIGS